MRLIVLSDIDEIEYSNVTGSAYNEYSSVASYDTGNNVKVSFESNGTTPRFPVKEYESLSDANSGNYPPDDATNWIEVGAENRCKMFDGFTNTQTTNAANINVEIPANGADTVGLFNLYGTEVTLRLIRDSATIKEETFDLRTIIPSSGWYSWLFSSYEYGITQLIWNFPKYAAGATLSIEITTRSSEAKCGLVVLGLQRTLALTEYGPKTGIDDYSIKDTDFLGRTYLSQGNFAKRADVEMWLENAQYDFVARQLASVRGVPAIFDFNNADLSDFQSLAIYGYIQNFDMMIPGPAISKVNIEVRGLI